MRIRSWLISALLLPLAITAPAAEADPAATPTVEPAPRSCQRLPVEVGAKVKASALRACVIATRNRGGFYKSKTTVTSAVGGFRGSAQVNLRPSLLGHVKVSTGSDVYVTATTGFALIDGKWVEETDNPTTQDEVLANTLIRSTRASLSTASDYDLTRYCRVVEVVKVPTAARPATRAFKCAKLITDDPKFKVTRAEIYLDKSFRLTGSVVTWTDSGVRAQAKSKVYDWGVRNEIVLPG